MKSLNWHVDEVETQLRSAYESGLEVELLKVLKGNTFLFYDIFRRKYSPGPVFHEVGFGNLRCDFAWLNDDSSGPEWTLVEVESPSMPLFRQNGKPSHKLNGALDQVKSWRRHFETYPGDRRQIFGAVAKFRYILIAGMPDDWQERKAMGWSADNNRTSEIEVRSFGTFDRSLAVLRQSPSEMWAFEREPVSLSPSRLQGYWEKHNYITRMREMF